MVEAKAPAVIKLLGEHAVVYGKLSLAAAISLYARAKVESTSSGFELSLPDIGKSAKFGADTLARLYDSFASRKSINEYVEENKGLAEALPFATVLAVASEKYGIKNKKAVLSSQIPMQKGFASSAALSTALATALLAQTSHSDSEIVELARTGEIVMHRSEGAGKIDVNTSYYGGYVSYSQQEGARKLSIETRIDLLAIDTGPKKSTAETVAHVAQLYKSEREQTEKILGEIEACTKRGIEALMKKDIKALGKEMYADHGYLSLLGVSSEGLDKAVEIAKKTGSLGAKLSGGGGGGMAIAINTQGLEKALEAQGFKCQELAISLKGA
ncbi:MAG: mevalonate kinase, partial [Candidatus Micrarchaeia archaeon]